MADVTWSPTDSGNVLDTDGNVVGTADGAGTFDITSNVRVGTSSGSTNDTLTIESGCTIEVGSGLSFIVYAYPTNSVYGTLIADGVIFTSSQATPAPGDWGGANAGFRFLGNTAAASPDLLARIHLTDCIIEYASTCIQSQTAAGIVATKVTASGCVFRKFTSSALYNNGAYGFDEDGVSSYPQWEFYNCQFILDEGDSTGASPMINCATGGATPTLDQRAHIWMDHCSFLFKADSTSDFDIFRVNNRSAITVYNCVAVGANSGAGDLGMANISSTGVALPNGWNFYLTDVDGTGGTYQYSAAATDQNVDPNYQDDMTYPFDLAPDAQAGDPDLYLADQHGSFPGAVEPYNYPSGDPVDPEGTTGVWAGKKQRVYESGFGTDASKTLGRAIRVSVASSDLFGEKILAGIHMKVNPERLK